MKYVKLFAIVFLGIVMFQSCSEDTKEGALEFNFKLLYDGNPLVAGQEYEYPLGFNFFVSKFSMFLSEISIENSTSTFDISDAIFLDLAAEQFDPEAATRGASVRFENIPQDEYTSLNISLGLPGLLNETNPSNYLSNSPLANTGEYWAGWESYIFHKLEGKMDPDGDGELDTGIALHIGSDDAYRSRVISKNIRIDGGETTLVEIELDLKDVLTIDGQPFDLKETPQVHHLGVLPKVLPIMDNLIQGF